MASRWCGSFNAVRIVGAKVGVVLFLCLSLPLIWPSPLNAQSSCCTQRGNINGSADGTIDILDLTYLVSYMFRAGPPPPCVDAADVNGLPAQIDILDLTYLVGWMFKSGPAPVPCPSGISFAQREAIFNAIDSVENANASLPPDSLAAVFVAYLLTHPVIEAAAVIDSISAWARFTDGRLFLMPNNRPPTGSLALSETEIESEIELTTDDAELAQFIQPNRRYPDLDWQTLVNTVPVAQPKTDIYELPSTVQARVISTLSSPCFTTSKTTLENLLQNNGYVMASSDGSVNGLLGVSGDGVYYMDAHCGSAVTKNQITVRAIWTMTTCSNTTETAFAGMLDANELVYMRMSDRIPATGACGLHVRYAFTGLFAAQYMTFAQNSFVMINACQSDEISLRAGFQLAGASVYAGWSQNVSDPAANKAGEFLIDRMLGASSSTLTPLENPPQRPFDIMPLQQDMQNRGFDFDPQTGARLRSTRLQGGFDLLAPSIQYLSIHEGGDTLWLVGIFGSDPGSNGRVIVGGTEMLVYQWEPGLIVAFIPNTGAGSVGPVTVEVDGQSGPSSSVKRKSNVVNITEWRGVITYTNQNSGTLMNSIVIDLHLRADVHRFRTTPHAAPMDQSVLILAAEDSFGSASAAGTYSFTWPFTDPAETWTWTWSGFSYLPGLWEQTPEFTVTAFLNTTTRVMDLTLVAAENTDLIETVVSSNQGTLWDSPIHVTLVSDIFDDPPYTMILNLSETFDIPALDRTVPVCCAQNPQTPENQQVRIHWPAMTASFPPDPTAAQ